MDGSCDRCGKLFKSKSSRKRFCSDPCRMSFWREAKAFPCYYCGCPADTQDHIPPRSFRAILKGKFKEHTVRACHECNCLLGARAIFTAQARKKFIKKALWRRYRREILSPKWNYFERMELSPNLRAVVYVAEAKRKLIQQRLEW